MRVEAIRLSGGCTCSAINALPWIIEVLLLGWSNASWRLQIEALNLLDSDDHDIDYFYASRLPGEPADGVEDIHFHIFEPRQLRLQATWLF